MLFNISILEFDADGAGLNTVAVPCESGLAATFEASVLECIACSCFNNSKSVSADTCFRCVSVGAGRPDNTSFVSRCQNLGAHLTHALL